MTEKTTDLTFAEDVLASSIPVLVDFWAEWCGPCRVIAPFLEQIGEELGEKVKILKLNVDENPKMSAQFGIRSIPTLILFKDGKVAATKTGAGSKSDLQRWIVGALG